MRHAAAVAMCLLILGQRPSLCQATVAARTAAGSARAARIRAEARSILSDPEFGTGAPRTGVFEYLGRQIRVVLEALGRWLSRFFRFGGATAPIVTANVLYWALLGSLAVGMAYVLAFALRRLGRLPGGASPGADVVDLEDPEATASQEPEVWLNAARRHATAGDFLRAYRAVFIALLLRLDRAGAIQYERGRTNGDYLRVLRKRPDLLAIVRPLSADFDAHWYGRRPVALPEYERAVGSYERAVGRLEPEG